MIASNVDLFPQITLEESFDDLSNMSSPVDVIGRSTSPDARHSQISIEIVRLRNLFLAFRQVDSAMPKGCAKSCRI